MRHLPLVRIGVLTLTLSVPLPAFGQTTPPPKQAAAAAKAEPKLTATEHLAKQPELVPKLQPLVPAGMTVQSAAAGFPTLGEFVASLHLSKNLGISFAQLKAKVTGDKAETLDIAVHELKPAVNAPSEVKKAKAQAKLDEGKGKQIAR